MTCPNGLTGRIQGGKGALVIVQMLVVGVLVGLFYAAIRVRSPAPPLVGLAGLAGMLVGQGVLVWLFS
jgi:XapX domain-containing protein